MMRIATIAVILGVSSGTEGSGCQGASPPPVEVTWTIPDGPGVRGIELIGCVDWGHELDDAHAVLMPAWDNCAVQAWRRDGRLRVRSTPVRIDGDETAMHVAFDLPDGPIGGMGAEVRRSGSSVRIEGIIEGTPASRAGIQPGTRVLEVNGDRTSSMTTSQFVRRVTGPPGTPVVLTLQAPGASDPHREVLVRQRIP